MPRLSMEANTWTTIAHWLHMRSHPWSPPMFLVWDGVGPWQFQKLTGWFSGQADLETAFAAQLPYSWTLVNIDL